MKTSPNNQYAAFDFFVTAEHILDWIHPGRDSEPQRRNLRSKEPLLQIVSHIANGAKHFEAAYGHHKSVSDIEKERYYEPGCVEKGYFEEPLLIHLTENEAKSIGKPTIEAVELAGMVLDYWQDSKLVS